MIKQTPNAIYGWADTPKIQQSKLYTCLHCGKKFRVDDPENDEWRWCTYTCELKDRRGGPGWAVR